MNLAHWLARAGRASSTAPAVGLGTRVHQSYGALAERSARLAGALRTDLNLPTGSRVALVSANCPEYLEILYGIWHAGLAAVPVNAKLHPSEIAFILEHSGSALCFADDKIAGSLGPMDWDGRPGLLSIGGDDYERLFAGDGLSVQEVAPGDLAWLFYTSGTTGRPKGAMLTHRNLAVMSLAYLSDVDLVSPGDRILHAAPMSHGSGLYIMAHLARCGVSVVPESRGFDPSEIFRLAGHWRRLSLFAAPTRRTTSIPTVFVPLSMAADRCTSRMPRRHSRNSDPGWRRSMVRAKAR